MMGQSSRALDDVIFIVEGGSQVCGCQTSLFGLLV